MRWRRALWIALADAISGGGGAQAQPAALPPPRHLRANGTEIQYVDQGAGAPVVFVHGAFSDLRYWEPQREAIAARHRFVAFTLRHHGVNPRRDDGQPYSAAVHAADLVAFIRELGLGRVHLVGLSYGGLVVLLVASEHPDLVQSLTLAEPGASSLLADTPEGKRLVAERLRSFEPIRAAVQAGDTARATKMFVEWADNRRAGDFAREPEAVRTMALDNARTLPLLLAAPPPPPISCATLRGMRVPTLVIGGERTRRFYSAINEVVARCLPGSRLTTIPTATHLTSHHSPAVFNDAILRFIDEQ